MEQGINYKLSEYYQLLYMPWYKQKFQGSAQTSETGNKTAFQKLQWFNKNEIILKCTVAY